MKLEDIVNHLKSEIQNRYRITEHAICKEPIGQNWIIASDYVIGDPNRSNDVICFTSYPMAVDLHIMQENLRRDLPVDLKKTRNISEQMIDGIKRSHSYSNCFVINRNRRLFVDRDDIRKSIGSSVEIAESWTNADGHQNIIKSLKTLRQQALSNNFNVKLFSDIVLISTCAVVHGLVITDLCYANSLHWWSDRDKIVEAYDKIAFLLFELNFRIFGKRHNLLYEHVRLGYPGQEDPLSSPWWDDFIRIPDYLAGSLSDFNLEKQEFTSQRHMDILTGAVADASNINCWILDAHQDRFSCSQISVTRVKSTDQA